MYTPNIMDTAILCVIALFAARLQIIVNPPYQEESSGDSTGTNPVYHHFIDGATEIGDYVELITPARFLFNAGKTPKAWNEKMLSDRHFKVLMYSQDPNKVFPGVPITGGVAVSCWNANDDHDPIGTFVPYVSTYQEWLIRCSTSHRFE